MAYSTTIRYDMIEFNVDSKAEYSHNVKYVYISPAEMVHFVIVKSIFCNYPEGPHVIVAYTDLAEYSMLCFTVSCLNN